jgi:ferredoxin
MTLHFDRSLCHGHGRCQAVAPETFELDDLGYLAMEAQKAISATDKVAILRGVKACPESAMHVTYDIIET